MTPQNAVATACKILGGQAALAKTLNVKPPTVNQWASGERPVPAARAVEIERATKGAVSRKSLCPDFPWDLDGDVGMIGAA